MEYEKDLRRMLTLSVALIIIFLFINVSSAWYFIPAGLIVGSLLYDRLAHWIIQSLSAVINFFFQLISKTIISVLFFVLLFPAIIIQQLIQKFDS